MIVYRAMRPETDSTPSATLLNRLMSESPIYSVVSASSEISDLFPYRGKVLHNCPRQSCVAALVQRDPPIDDLDDSSDPFRDLLKDVPELDLFTVLVAITSPAV